jgi:hypothetical protein
MSSSSISLFTAALASVLLTSCGGRYQAPLAPAEARDQTLWVAPAAAWRAQGRLLVDHDGREQRFAIEVLAIEGRSLRVLLRDGEELVADRIITSSSPNPTGVEAMDLAQPFLIHGLLAQPRGTTEWQGGLLIERRGPQIRTHGGDPLLPRLVEGPWGQVICIDWRWTEAGLLPHQLKGSRRGVRVELQLTELEDPDDTFLNAEPARVTEDPEPPPR